MSTDSEDRLSPEQASRLFWCFALLHCLAWIAVPTLFGSGYRTDVLEEYTLVRECFPGSEYFLASLKHPNMPAWILGILTFFLGYGYGIPYLAAQLMVLLAVWSIWRLGRQMLSESSALIGSLAFLSFIYCTYRTLEYNHTLVAMSFWAFSLLLLYRAFRQNRRRDWIVLGLALGAGLNSHFLFFNLCFAVLVFMFWDSRTRRLWRNPGPYLSLGISFLCFVPQLLVMLHRSRITTWSFFTEIVQGKPVVADHLIQPLLFAGSQLCLIFPILLVLFPLTGLRWRFRPLKPDERFERRFLLFFTFFPFLCLLIAAAYSGARLSPRYGSQLWPLVGPLVLFHVRTTPSVRARKRSLSMLVGIDALVLGYVLIAFALMPVLGKPSTRIHFPVHELGRQSQIIWNRYYTDRCPFVGGEFRLAAGAGIGMDDHPKIQAATDSFDFPTYRFLSLHTDEETNRHGGMVFWKIDDRYPDKIPKRLYERYPDAIVQPPIRLKYGTLFGDCPFEVGTAIVPIPGVELQK